MEKYSVHMGEEEAGSEVSLWILKGQGKKDAVAEGGGDGAGPRNSQPCLIL